MPYCWSLPSLLLTNLNQIVQNVETWKRGIVENLIFPVQKLAYVGRILYLCTLINMNTAI